MSKTTTFLFIILFLSLCSLGFLVTARSQQTSKNAMTKPAPLQSPTTATLSLVTQQKAVHAGKTVQIFVMINNPLPHPNLAQLNLAYDPTVITVDSITPGTYFKNPTIVLQTIDATAGRVSYALRCPQITTSQVNDCVSQNATTIAILTITINPYSYFDAKTTLSFLPKSVVRINPGHDILQKTTNVQLSILPEVASPSARIFFPETPLNVTPIR